jgi:hypothetical protein
MLSVAYSEGKTQQDNSQLIIPKEVAHLHQNLTNVSYFGNYNLVHVDHSSNESNDSFIYLFR